MRPKEESVRGRVVMKLGGSLITNKSSPKGLDMRAIEDTCSVVKSIIGDGFIPILIHGAGSFGHILAKKWSIQDGSIAEIVDNQREAVIQIRMDMRELSSVVISCLEKTGVRSEMLPPSDWAIGTGPSFEGDLVRFERSAGDIVPVTFGDVVDTQGSSEFGILSGDDLMLRISKEVSNVSHSIFLMGGVDGVLDKPPTEGGSLVRLWSPNTEIEHEHESEVDVTGGIALKIDRASEIAETVDEVWILNGDNPERIMELLRDGSTTGTKIVDSRGT